MKKLLFAPVVAAFLILSGCSKKDSDDTPEVLVPMTIELQASDNMAFVGTTEYNVKSKQEITLNFKNIGKLPKEAMGHNVVILKPGTDVGAFANEAFKAKSSDYIPATYASSIVAHTKLLGPGESDTIKFTFVTPGVYDFVCSFPGHAGTMKGSFTVK